MKKRRREREGKKGNLENDPLDNKWTYIVAHLFDRYTDRGKKYGRTVQFNLAPRHVERKRVAPHRNSSMNFVARPRREIGYKPHNGKHLCVHTYSTEYSTRARKSRSRPPFNEPKPINSNTFPSITLNFPIRSIVDNNGWVEFGKYLFATGRVAQTLSILSNERDEIIYIYGKWIFYGWKQFWKERIYRVSIVIRIATKQLKLRIGEQRGKIKERYSWSFRSCHHVSVHGEQIRV